MHNIILKYFFVLWFGQKCRHFCWLFSRLFPKIRLSLIIWFPQIHVNGCMYFKSVHILPDEDPFFPLNSFLRFVRSAFLIFLWPKTCIRPQAKPQLPRKQLILRFLLIWGLISHPNGPPPQDDYVEVYNSLNMLLNVLKNLIL